MSCSRENLEKLKEEEVNECGVLSMECDPDAVRRSAREKEAMMINTQTWVLRGLAFKIYDMH